MIKEIIVVEGRDDISAVKRAVDAEVIATGGFAWSKVLRQIQEAHRRRGVIILTDPDHAGEHIRARLAAALGPCKHAFVDQDACNHRGDIGVEHASPAVIRRALTLARCETIDPPIEFSMQDLFDHGLTGSPHATHRRLALASQLGIGYANARQLLNRLNRYGVTRHEFNEALHVC